MKINIDLIYPVGAVYISTTDINPSLLFGGEWVQTCKSRALVGAGENEANTDNNWGTFDANSYTLSVGARIGEVSHTLSVSEMPSHKHDIHSYNDDYNGTQSGDGRGFIKDGTYSYINQTDLIQPTGGGSAHNNIQPIEVFYIWKRIA